MSLDLTIAIPVLNEEKNLAGCLQAIGKDFCKSIVVIDSGSTDKTIEVARSFGAEVVQFRWDGKFPKKRNWFLRNYSFTTSWIFFLDADEWLTPGFKTELNNCLGDQEFSGYWLNYTIFFMGAQLKGGYPLKKLALFRVGAGEYEKIEEENWSRLDMEVHEHPMIAGKIGNIKSKIEHRDFRNLNHYISKHNDYASWEAFRYQRIKNNLKNISSFTWKQRIKYSLLASVWIGPVYFFGSYFLLGGFRDGKRGLAFAIMKMTYFNQVYCKICELNQKA